MRREVVLAIPIPCDTERVALTYHRAQEEGWELSRDQTPLERLGWGLVVDGQDSRVKDGFGYRAEENWSSG